jgi:hypothetical protein
VTATILPFSGKHCPIYYASREEIEWRGRVREKWIVIKLQPDGECSWHGPLPNRKEAEWLASILAKAATKDRVDRAENPQLDAIIRLPTEYQGMMTEALRRQFGGSPPKGRA